jgi:hypothetical protein
MIDRAPMPASATPPARRWPRSGRTTGCWSCSTARRWRSRTSPCSSSAVLFDAALTRRGERVTIVGATSGDTGAAAIEAFRGLDAVDVFILFPEGRVSEVQRRQMTTPAERNVHALAVQGDFDACQALVKAMFNDFPFRDAVGWPRSTRSTGRGCWRRRSITSPPPWRSARRGAPSPMRADGQFRRHLRRRRGAAHGAAGLEPGDRHQQQRHPAPHAADGRHRQGRRSRRPSRPRWTSRSRRISSGCCSTCTTATGRGGAADGALKDEGGFTLAGRARQAARGLRLGARHRRRRRHREMAGPSVAGLRARSAHRRGRLRGRGQRGDPPRRW